MELVSGEVGEEDGEEVLVTEGEKLGEVVDEV